MGIESAKLDAKFPLGRSGMRSTFFFSVFSLAVLSLFGWVRHDAQRASGSPDRDISADEEIYLFVG